MKKTTYPLRTQISLSLQLRNLIDAQRVTLGESLSEYLRKAAILRMIAEDIEKKDLDLVAGAVVGKVAKSKSGWKKVKNIVEWQKKERKHENKHRS